jgi:hypothetical protein
MQVVIEMMDDLSAGRPVAAMQRPAPKIGGATHAAVGGAPPLGQGGFGGYGGGAAGAPPYGGPPMAGGAGVPSYAAPSFQPQPNYGQPQYGGGAPSYQDAPSPNHGQPQYQGQQGMSMGVQAMQYGHPGDGIAHAYGVQQPYGGAGVQQQYQQHYAVPNSTFVDVPKFQR